MFTKRARYYFNHDAILEPAKFDGRKDTRMKGSPKYAPGVTGLTPQSFTAQPHERWQMRDGQHLRNKRSMWTVATKPLREAHFAPYPPDLIVPCIQAKSKKADNFYPLFCALRKNPATSDLNFFSTFVWPFANFRFVDYTLTTSHLHRPPPTPSSSCRLLTPRLLLSQNLFLLLNLTPRLLLNQSLLLLSLSTPPNLSRLNLSLSLLTPLNLLNLWSLNLWMMSRH
jgi:hypothetical protein